MRPAVRVVLRVRARYHNHVQRQPHEVALDLDVALLHEVEEPNLDALREVRQLVDAEDAPVGPRDEPVVDGELVREVAALRDAYRVDVAHQVGDRDVGRRELLPVALVAPDPVDGRVVALLRNELDGVARDGGKRVVVHLAPLHDGDLFVEQLDEGADHARLRLPALAKQDEVLPREDGILHLRDDGVLVAHDAGEDGFAVPQAVHEVAAQLVADGHHGVAAVAQRAEGRWALPVRRLVLR